MGRISLTAFVGIIALTLAACASGEDNTVVQPITPSTPKPFAKPPLVAQNPQTRVIASTSGLIQPTNANERTQQVQKGRQDPFAALFVPVVPKVPATPRQKPVPPLPKLPAPAPKPPVVVQPSPPPNRVPTPLPTVAPSPLPPALPPQPQLANNVAVLGVVQIGNETQAIVQVPNEATSRYVGQGQRLSNGQVLVKRIEVNTGSEPIVILEENGIEVSKAVGETPTEQRKTSPTAAIPGSFSSLNSPVSLEARPNNLGQTTPTVAIPVPSPPSSSAPLNRLRNSGRTTPRNTIPTLPPENDENSSER